MKKNVAFNSFFKTATHRFNDLLWLVFPEHCAACSKALIVGEQFICTRCLLDLPKTNFHLDSENKVVKLFWGKVPVEFASAFYYFRVGEKVQQLIHNFKYRGQKEVGVYIGELYGKELKVMSSDFDVVIPVPLHPSKQRRRGFNQSEYFANGLSSTLEIPLLTNAVRRTQRTDSQTKKQRYARFENMQKKFAVVQPEQLQGKHILLVDDVVTTGSTLTACAEAVLTIPGTRVSFATIACA